MNLFYIFLFLLKSLIIFNDTLRIHVVITWLLLVIFKSFITFNRLLRCSGVIYEVEIKVFLGMRWHKIKNLKSIKDIIETNQKSND
jgi:hypothetical protein